MRPTPFLVLPPLLAACLAQACATQPAPTPAPSAATTTATTTTTTTTTAAAVPARSVDLTVGDGRLMVAGVVIHQTTDEFRGVEVGAPAARLFAALPAAYEAAGLRLDGVDTEKRAVVAANVRAQVQLAKVRLSQYVDCGGAGSMGGRAADSYAITFNIATQVVPVGDDRADVRTLVQAFGRPSSNSGQPVHCNSTGRLEQRIAELAASRLTP